MNNLGDYLKKKTQDLDLNRATEISKIQDTVDQWFPGKIRVKSLNNNKLVLVVVSSSVANELRFKQQEIILQNPNITKIIISNH